MASTLCSPDVLWCRWRKRNAQRQCDTSRSSATADSPKRSDATSPQLRSTGGVIATSCMRSSDQPATTTTTDERTLISLARRGAWSSLLFWVYQRSIRCGHIEFVLPASREQLRQSASRRGARGVQRAREVRILVVTGLLSKQIAAQLRTSEATVKAHRAQLMRKMEADSVAQLVRIAEGLSLLPPRR